MNDEEAICIQGFERFSNYEGYANLETHTRVRARAHTHTHPDGQMAGGREDRPPPRRQHWKRVLAAPTAPMLFFCAACF